MRFVMNAGLNAGQIPTLMFDAGKILNDTEITGDKRFPSVDSRQYVKNQLSPLKLATIGKQSWCWVKVNLVTPKDPKHPENRECYLHESNYAAWIQAKPVKPSTDAKKTEGEQAEQQPLYNLTIKHGHTKRFSNETEETKALTAYWHDEIQAHIQEHLTPKSTDDEVPESRQSLSPEGKAGSESTERSPSPFSVISTNEEAPEHSQSPLPKESASVEGNKSDQPSLPNESVSVEGNKSDQPPLPKESASAEDTKPSQPPLPNESVSAEGTKSDQPSLPKESASAEDTKPSQPPLPTESASVEGNKSDQPSLPKESASAEDTKPSQPPLPTESASVEGNKSDQPSLPNESASAEDTKADQPSFPKESVSAEVPESGQPSLTKEGTNDEAPGASQPLTVTVAENLPSASPLAEKRYQNFPEGTCLQGVNQQWDAPIPVFGTV